MSKKDSFIYIFLIIITFGLIFLYWKKKKTWEKNFLTIETKMSLNIDSLKTYLGSEENISEICSTQNKIKFTVNDINRVQVKNIETMKGISGVFVTSKAIQIIVGKSAQSVKSKFIKGQENG